MKSDRDFVYDILRAMIRRGFISHVKLETYLWKDEVEIISAYLREKEREERGTTAP